MSEMDDLLTDAFSSLLGDVAGPAVARAAETEGNTSGIWAAVQESGFVDALIPEAAGGAGLSRDAVVPLFRASAEQLLPVAFDHSMIARLLIHEGGQSASFDAPVLLWPLTDDGRLRSQVAPAAHSAGYALTQQGSSFALRSLASVDTRDGFDVQEAVIDDTVRPILEFALDGVDLLDWCAALAAGAIAGRVIKAFELSQSYVTERKQFGRPLGNFQAIQHMISQAAEHMVLAATAARYALVGEGPAVDPNRAAVGKSVASAAAIAVASIAHAVHGAIGVSEEYDLQLYTRQLKRLSVSYGSGSYWADRIGAARLSHPQGTSIDFVRKIGTIAA